MKFVSYVTLAGVRTKSVDADVFAAMRIGSTLVILYKPTLGLLRDDFRIFMAGIPGSLFCTFQKSSGKASFLYRAIGLEADSQLIGAGLDAYWDLIAAVLDRKSVV